jgi:hypothetical protein
MHPNCQALFCFDQSSNHAAMPKDALLASKMNLGDNGKNVPLMKDGWFEQAGHRVSQPMQNEKEPKGIKTVLMERGLWPEKGFRLDCPTSCTAASAICCARKLLASQPDFLEQKSSLEEVVSKAGHLLEFFPKFHCECNFIERFWGEGKRIARAECHYTFGSLKGRVPKILSNIPLSHIRAYHRKSWRYIHAYSMKLSGRLAEWAVKRYKSHRKISDSVEKIVTLFKQECGDIIGDEK